MAPSGRYKSRLLNYLVEQSHKLSDQAGQRLRQARTGIVWGAQVLIYPLYAAFQTSRLIGRRLSQGGPRTGQARLTPPKGDEVVNAVISLARELADQGAITIAAPQPSEIELGERQTLEPASLTGLSPNTALPAAGLREVGGDLSSTKNGGVSIAVATPASPGSAPHYAAPLKSAEIAPANLASNDIALLGGVDIRGVASELSNRSLVLIDNSNRTVPLEAEQQWKLQQTIVQQVADYNYRRQRYSQQLTLVESRDRPLPLLHPRAKQLSGIRWVTHLMGWMQTGDLAVATNLFKESELSTAAIAPPPFLYWDPEPGQRLTRETLAQLDYPLANLEERYIQNDEQEDKGTKALRFTARLFGLEEAAEQWLKAAAKRRPPSSGGETAAPPNPHAPRVGFSTDPITQIKSGELADPWGDQKGLPEPSRSQTPQAPLPSSAYPPRKPSENWLGSLLNPTSPPTAASPNASGEPSSNAAHLQGASPKGWQRLTHRFGGLINQLRKPSGPITPLKPRSNQTKQPPGSSAPAPTNETLGHGKAGSEESNLGIPTSHRQGGLAQASQSDDHIEAAWQKRVSKAIAKQTPEEITRSPGSKSENVTLRSKAKGAQAVAASTSGTALGKVQESNDPNTSQTAETAVTYESPYVETTATFSGYEKHPLEAILEWLDRILLWIEELGLRLWQWLRHAGEQ